MTEQKKPERDQWWNIDLYGRVLIEAVTDRDVCIRYDGNKFVVIYRSAFHGLYLPECTGFDWQPPDWVTQDRVPARPGIDQRRWKRNADGTFTDWCMTKKGMPLTNHGYVDKFADVLELRCLRKDLPPLPEVWPKFVEHKTRFRGCEAYIVRHSKTEAEIVLKDGSKCEYNWGVRGDKWIQEGSWVEITESEAISRIVKPAKTCVMCNGPADITDDSCKQCHEFAIEQVCGVRPDLKIYMSVDGILYAASEPQQTTHTRVRILGDGVDVI